MCIVCIGGNFQNSLEVTSLLKDLGAKYVVSKADRDIHAKFLLRNGADEVIYPDRDNAVSNASADDHSRIPFGKFTCIINQYWNLGIFIDTL